jgi:hypothetical protein
MKLKIKKLLRKAASKALDLAEKAYLLAYGWEKYPHVKGAWISPEGYPKRHDGITQGHAINSMKKYMHSPGGPWDPETDRLN